MLGIMPPSTMSDDDIAAVLTYLSGLDHAPVSFTAREIGRRGHSLNYRPPRSWRSARLSDKKIAP